MADDENETLKPDKTAPLFGRRKVLIGAVATTTLGIANASVSERALADTGATEAGEGATPANELFAQAGDRFQIVRGKLRDQMLRPELLEPDAKPVEAFPLDPSGNVLRRRNRLNRVLALRLSADNMDEETRARCADGVLVFSALCTHRACKIQSWMPEERHMRCHCHLSEFAALTGGTVMAGPARRQLPMIPLGLDSEGFIVAKNGFTDKPGGAKK